VQVETCIDMSLQQVQVETCTDMSLQQSSCMAPS